jgi:hypothetical protein
MESSISKSLGCLFMTEDLIARARKMAKWVKPSRESSLGFFPVLSEFSLSPSENDIFHKPIRAMSLF